MSVEIRKHFQNLQAYEWTKEEEIGFWDFVYEVKNSSHYSEIDQKIRGEWCGIPIMDSAIIKEGFAKDLKVYCQVIFTKT